MIVPPTQEEERKVVVGFSVDFDEKGEVVISKSEKSPRMPNIEEIYVLSARVQRDLVIDQQAKATAGEVVKQMVGLMRGAFKEEMARMRPSADAPQSEPSPIYREGTDPEIAELGQTEEDDQG